MALGFERAVAEILETAVPSFGTYNVDIHIGQSEADPRDAKEFAIVMEAGSAPISGRSIIGESLGFTVQTRAPTYEEAQEEAWKVHYKLHAFEGVVRSVPIARIMSNFPPQPLGQDEREEGGHWRVTESFTAITRVVPFT